MTELQEREPSKTALGAAMLRAAHQMLDTPLVFADPLALKIVGVDAEAALRADLPLHSLPERRSQRANIAARSRLAEDELTKAVASGVRQYVLLGAGLDTFACRNPYEARGLRVFEVDHPATQAWKRERLLAAGIGLPNSLVFAAVNFERQTLGEGLAAAGFDASAPAFFAWLGVTIYLTREAIRETLKFVAGQLQGSAVVFTYSTPPDKLAPEQRAVFAARAKRVAAIGEPWRTFFEPPELAQELRNLGFRSIEDLGPAEIQARYFSGRSDGLQPGPAGHLMLAGV